MTDVEKAKEAEAEIQAEVKTSPKPSPTKSTGTISSYIMQIFSNHLTHSSTKYKKSTQ